MKLHSEKLLTSFIRYCIKHPDERFWQALTNWSGFSFIFGSKSNSFEDYSNLTDVYYMKGKNEHTE